MRQVLSKTALFLGIAGSAPLLQAFLDQAPSMWMAAAATVGKLFAPGAPVELQR